MKKLFFLSAFMLLIASVSFAQENDQKMWVGGSLSLENSGSYSYVGFFPEFGMFLNDSWAVGGRLGISNSSYSNTTSMTLAPYARYKMFNLGKLSFYGQAEFIVGLSNADIYLLRVLPVVTYPVYKNLGLTATLPKVLSVGENGGTSEFELDVNSDFAPVRIGITYKF